MPSLFRMLTYGVMIVLLVITLGGGFGVLMPTIFNLNTDLVFVLLPLCMAFIVAISISLVHRIVRMIRTDVAKFNKE